MGSTIDWGPVVAGRTPTGDATGEQAPVDDVDPRTTAWRDHRDRPVVVPAPPTAEQPPFYLPISAWQGAHYDRNAFTAGTLAEVDALVERTGLVAGQRVLDVGCGTGRHLRELRRRDIDGVGVDVSRELVEVAVERLAADEADDRPRGDWEVVVGDARHLAATLRRADLAGTFDVAWSLCHGGFGTDPEAEVDVLAGLAEAVRDGGYVVLTAFHALFAVRHLVAGDAFDPQRLVHHQRSEVRGPDDQDRVFDLWTVTHTVADLEALAAEVGLEVVSVDGAEPGAYDRHGVGLDDPELLAVLRA